MRRGAGIYVIAPTARMLLGLRSGQVNDAFQWCGFGGGLERGETLLECAVRELREETGYPGSLDVTQVTRQIFLGVVPEEFEPTLNWEHEAAAWFTFAETVRLRPKHWTLRQLLRSL